MTTPRRSLEEPDPQSRGGGRMVGARPREGSWAPDWDDENVLEMVVVRAARGRELRTCRWLRRSVWAWNSQPFTGTCDLSPQSSGGGQGGGAGLTGCRGG